MASKISRGVEVGAKLTDKLKSPVSTLLQKFVPKDVQRIARAQRKGAKLTKKQKFNLAAAQITAVLGVTDAIVATDGTQTVSDFFE